MFVNIPTPLPVLPGEGWGEGLPLNDRTIVREFLKRCMPTVLKHGPYRFFFFSKENGEPPHIHVERDAAYAKLWLDPVRLARTKGFAAHEINELIRITAEHEQLFLERWHEYFGR